MSQEYDENNIEICLDGYSSATLSEKLSFENIEIV